MNRTRERTERPRRSSRASAAPLVLALAALLGAPVNAGAAKAKAKAGRPKPMSKVAPKAAPAQPAPKPQPEPVHAAPAGGPAVAPAQPPQSPPAAASLAAQSTTALLEKAQAAYSNQDYDQAVPLAEEVLRRPDVPTEQKLDAYRLLGSSNAILADPQLAERSFRLLLRLKPDFALPVDTSPKIAGVFRKVQAEESALADQVATMGRARLVEQLELAGDLPRRAFGGYPIAISLRLKDPTGAVEAVRLPYRRTGQGEYSSVALARMPDGSWQGRVPGEATANPDGMKLEYFLETADRRGPLLQVGSPARPLTVDVTAGAKVRERPPPVPRAAFWTALGATLAVGAAGGGVGLVTRSKQDQYSALAASARSTPVAASQFTRMGAEGDRLASATNVLLVVTAAFAVATGVLVPFVNWDDVPDPAQ